MERLYLQNGPATKTCMTRYLCAFVSRSPGPLSLALWSSFVSVGKLSLFGACVCVCVHVFPVQLAVSLAPAATARALVVLLKAHRLV